MSADPTTPEPADATHRAEVAGSSGFQVGSGNTQINVGVDHVTLPPPQTPGAGDGVPHNLPPASAVFEGRDVAQLAGLFGDTGAGVVVGQAAVHGLGGIGKSELANQYARAFLGRYRLVWWVTAENRQAVGLGLSALTARLHPVATLADAQTWALGWLQKSTGWLLVLDNVEDLADIADLLGVVAGRGQVLVTTRRNLGAQWRRLGLKPLRLDVLDRAASVRLLGELTGLDDTAGAGRLAQALGDLPLGLRQAAAYVSQHEGMTFDDYIQLLAEEFDRAAGDPGEGESGQATVAAVWAVTVTAVRRKSPLAITVLEVLAGFSADELPETVVSALTDDPRDVADALAVLASYSMIMRRSGAVTVHRLVQAVTRSAATTAGHGDTVRDTAVRLLADAAPDDPINNVAGWPLWAA